MNKESRKELKINKILIIMGVVCSILAITIIALPNLNKAKIETLANSSKQMEHNYTTSTESNTWDISKNGDGSVIATLNGNGLLTIAGSGGMKSWNTSNSVPWDNLREKIKNVKIENGVTSISRHAFQYCSSLTSIEIPEGVTSIGIYAFYYCTSLISIQIPESVTSLENYVFEGCTSLTSIEIPESVTSIGDSAFDGCTSLTSIEIPESVTNILDGAFYGCTSLTSIEIPSSVISIGEVAFKFCTSLTNIKISEGVTSIGAQAFTNCTSLTSIEIPSSVTSIEWEAFRNCKSLTSIAIPANVTSIGKLVFSGCASLTSIEIPASVTSIGDSAFSGCKSLESIKILEGVTSIGERAFWGCTSLTSIEIPSSVTSIKEEAFSSCQVTEFLETKNNIIELPELLKRVRNESDILYSNEEFTLTNCTIEDGKIKISEGEAYGKIKINGGALDGLIYVITYTEWDISKNGDGSVIATLDKNGLLTVSGIGDMVSTNEFSIPWYSVREKIKNVKIENGITSIGSCAFDECRNLTSVAIPTSVTRIEFRAFYYCISLTSIEIPSSVESIQAGAFSRCTSLTSVEIPASVTSVDDGAFSGCTSLTSIEVDAKNEKYCDENGILYTKDKKKIISYPAGKIETTYTIINGVTSIGSYAFHECKNLTSIEIPASVTSIGREAFGSCTSLTSIEIPVSVTSIGNEAFRNCTSLTSIEIPASVTSIGYQALEGCTSLTSIEIPASVTNIGDMAFYYCRSLKSIIIPSSVTSIGNSAFSNCTNLTIICQSGSTAETYAKENSIKYQTDDIGPKIESTPATNTNPSKKIEVKINVTDEIAGLNEQSIKYLWSEESQNITKDQIIKECANGETLQLKDVTGTYYLWIYAVDKLGNETIEKKGPFKLDNTAPTANINYSTTTITNQNVKVTIKANEELQGITGWTKSSNGKELTKEYTSNTVEAGENITIKDLAGNESTVNVKVLNIDKERPTVNLSYSTTTITNQNVIVTIKGNEELQGITGWTKPSNGKELTKEYTSNTVEAGENITVKDLAGNESTVNVKVLNIDKELPTIEINTEITSTTIKVEVTASDTGSGINENSYKYYIKEENGTYGEGIADGNAHTFTNLKTEQKYYIKVEVTDNAENKASKEVQVIIKKSNKVTSTEYKINEEKLMIKEIQPKTTAGEIKNKIQGEMEFKIINVKGETVSDTAKVATGYKIKLEDNKEYTLVVTGDSNGDGETNIKDILSINKHRLNKANLVGSFLEAGDVNEDGKADIKDILQINKFRLGKITEI